MDTADETPIPPTPRFETYDCSDGCPVEAALEQIAGKWKGLIVYHLLGGTLRFNALARQVGGVTQRSLTKQLRELEADGIVARKVYAVVPPRVEYALTEKGRALEPAILALRAWGLCHARPGTGLVPEGAADTAGTAGTVA
ncbi:MAG: helix-turn-helix domain-containing protein [Pseudomonadota bacterium]